MSHSHDQNFKNMILDYPIEAIRFFAPQEAKKLEGAIKVIPLRQEQLKKKLGDRYRELDTPLMLEWPNSDQKALIFLMEEESCTSRFSISRLAHYCLDIYELFKTTRLIPVVIFLKGGQYQQELCLGSNEHSFLNFHFIACELSSLKALNYIKSDNIVARLNLPLMCYNENQRIEVYAQAVNGLMSLESSYHQQIKYLDFIEQYADLNETELAYYQANYLKQEAEGADKMGLVQTLRDEGEQKGRQEGETDLFLRLLKMKFIIVPDDIEQKVKNASSEQMILWSERLLKADKVDEIFIN